MSSTGFWQRMSKMSWEMTEWATAVERVFKTMAWNKERKRQNAATKSEAQKLMLQWKMKVKMPRKGSIVNFYQRWVIY